MFALLDARSNRMLRVAIGGCLKHFEDPEASIRTNALICVGRVSAHLPQPWRLEGQESWRIHCAILSLEGLVSHVMCAVAFLKSIYSHLVSHTWMITGHRHPSVKPWWQLLAWAWRTWDMGRISRVYIKIPQASQQSIVYYIYIIYKIQWHGCSIWNEGQPNRVILYPLAKTPAAVWNVFSTTWIHFRLWQRLVTIPHLLMSCYGRWRKVLMYSYCTL